MSRLPEEPIPAEVTVDGWGQPATIGWETGAGTPPRACPVIEVCARWRLDDDWWRLPISRMYYKLRTPTALVEVYRDLGSGEWFLERVHD